MIKPKLLVAALAVILLFTKANAQDTTHYDLGRIQVKKDFTQSITVKGEDLEKMPFTNLAEAINVWFYGRYTNVTNLVYIIDGNLVNDVNTYSIYDIDEITLIQNAVTTMSGASGPEQLIVIKTKRSNERGFGITADGQGGISSLYTNNIYNTQTNTYEAGNKSTNAVYQQYYIAAHENTGNVSFGISANYLRDGLPVIKQQSQVYNTPQTIDRLKFNTYLDVRMGKSVLDVTASYDPQKIKYVLNDVTVQNLDSYNDNSHIFNGTLSLTTHILPGFTNVIHGDYNYYRDNEYGNDYETLNDGYNEINYKGNSYNHNIVAYDNLSYNDKLGDWNFEPAINLNFRTLRDSSYYSNISTTDGMVEGNSYNYGAGKVHLFLLTPSISFYYKSFFNVQAGVLDNLYTFGVYNFNASKPQTVLPFINATADILQLINSSSSLSLKVYGSFSTNDLFTDNFNSLPNLYNQSTEIPVINAAVTTLAPFYGTGIYTSSASYLYQQASKTFKTFSAGLNIASKNIPITANYFFEKTSYYSPVFLYQPFGANGEQEISTYTSTNMILNRISINYKLSSSKFNWQMAVNGTMLKQNFPNMDNGTTKPSLGGGEWTGGWINRLTYRNFFAGADLLYHIGEKIYSESNTGTIVTNKFNSFSLQNLYAGYRLKINGLKAPEIYADARNIFQNKKEDITDDRKYIGVGFKLSL
jgi:hypothetical protein